MRGLVDLGGAGHAGQPGDVAAQGNVGQGSGPRVRMPRGAGCHPGKCTGCGA